MNKQISFDSTFQIFNFVLFVGVLSYQIFSPSSRAYKFLVHCKTRLLDLLLVGLLIKLQIYYLIHILKQHWQADLQKIFMKIITTTLRQTLISRDQNILCRLIPRQHEGVALTKLSIVLFNIRRENWKV